MKVFKPKAIESITSSTVAEDDYAEWEAITSYTVGARVIRTQTHSVYEAIVGGIDATPPEDALGGETPKWIRVKSTNKYAMFNDSIDDATSSTDDLVVSFSPDGGIEGIALFGLAGSSVLVVVTDVISGTEIFTATRSIDSSVVTNFYDWFYEEPDFTADVVFQDIPGIFQGVLVTVTVTKSTTAACGVCKVGQVSDIGSTLYGATLEIDDYSIKETDSFGYLQIVERGFIKRVQAKMITSRLEFKRIFNVLAPLRATPTVYITSDDADYESLLIYGIFYNFSIDVAYPSQNYCSLEIHGMVSK